ncbi:MAG: DUF5615 family PIN-like protein [Dyadobacter sp.]|uniref:DUF5615 family PIN-like protein n=1 Tax=Dyadobacter sp. TaxID=1914288 RepID=UPI001B2A84A2|nr:DUF5615 family PIN-like protein [Dyadobacter sp.]MBO9614642.1 DUF5615 family PIN-like protein [Dyadobacter sp.]
MIILDAHLPPAAVWISETFAIPCFSAQFLDLRHAEDEEIFAFSKTKNAVVITKDDDFISLLNRFGSPPKVIWLTCGNTSKNRLKEILGANLASALTLLETNDLVEITGI